MCMPRHCACLIEARQHTLHCDSCITAHDYCLLLSVCKLMKWLCAKLLQDMSRSISQFSQKFDAGGSRLCRTHVRAHGAISTARRSCHRFSPCHANCLIQLQNLLHSNALPLRNIAFLSITPISTGCATLCALCLQSHTTCT